MVYSVSAYMRYLALLLFMIPFIPVMGQEVKSPVEVLISEGRKTLDSEVYRERKAANAIFIQTLEAYISTQAGFDDPLKGVTNMLRLELGKRARLYTWQVPDSSRNYVKYGYVAAQMDKEIVVTPLRESVPLPEMQFKKLKATDWYGAIYYEAIPIGKKKQQAFTLLGLSMGKEINQKFVDVIQIDRKGRPRFGDKVFRIDQFMDKTLRKPPMRLILSYGAEYSASVRWNMEEERIIMDHLSPPDAKLKGLYRMYGPDMSYDALYWEDGWWHMESEVNFNTGQKIEIRPPDRPLDLPADNRGKKIERN